MKSEFPLLTEFCRGYLHEDVVPEHGDASGAATGYLADLSKVEQKQLATEAARFRASHKFHDTQALNRELRKMGSMWNFASLGEFEKVLETFERGQESGHPPVG